LEQDIFGQIPLHVAVACDASISVIDTLLVCHGDAVNKMQDARGRTPLMLACHKPPTESFKLGVYDKYEMAYLFGPADATYYPGPRIDIVKSLLLAAPRMINHEDDDECNALEFAVLSEAHEDITEALLNASQREWDRIKKSQALSINRKLSKDSLLSSIITATVKMEDYCESTISSGEPQIPDVLLTTVSSGCSFDSDLSLSDMSSQSDFMNQKTTVNFEHECIFLLIDVL
jgi:ankyrin repeat protein